jgi:general secretion pathway protein G
MLYQNHSLVKGSRRSSGFSMLEIVIAIALLVLISGVVISNLENVLGSGQQKTAEIFVRSTIREPLMRYRSDVGTYPSTEQGLQALLRAPEGVENWKGPYADAIPNDPWGRRCVVLWPRWTG